MEHPYVGSGQAKQYLALKPPSSTLSDSYDSMGRLMDLSERQAIANARAELLGQTVFTCDSNMGTWAENAAKRASKRAELRDRPPKKEGASVVYCAPCFNIPNFITSPD